MDSEPKPAVMASFIREISAAPIFYSKKSREIRSGRVKAFLSREIRLPLVSAISGLTLLFTA
jgi:hypothetical protein